MDASIPVLEKPHPHLPVSEWSRNIQHLQNESRTRRFDSYVLRQRASQLRNESSVTTRWDNFVNNQLLRDRLFEVNSWRDSQRHCREAVRDEARAMTEEKRATELALESLQIPLSVVSECLSTRDRRLPTELTNDPLGNELNLELHTIEKYKRALTELCHRGWETLRDLAAAAARLDREIQNKDETIHLDSYVKELTWESPNISFKLDPTRIPAETMTEQGYVDCIQNTLQSADSVMKESRALRAAMFTAREETANRLYAQSQAVELMLRRRVYDLQRARNEMEWQKSKLEENLDRVDGEIRRLRAAAAAATAPAQLVDTRLTARARRPALEAVDDRPARGLLEEHHRLRVAGELLERKLEEALSTHHGLRQHHSRVTLDLRRKQHALETDRSLLDARRPLHVRPSQHVPTSQNVSTAQHMHTAQHVHASQHVRGREGGRGVGYGRLSDELALQ